MNFPNITYLDGTLKKIEILEVTVYLAYLDFDQAPSFCTNDRKIIYLFIYQYPLSNEFERGNNKFQESMKKALINCKEIPKELRSSFENWTSWTFRIKKAKQCSKHERALFMFEQNDKLIYWLNEKRTNRPGEYFSILNNQATPNNINFIEHEK
ncbi:MAG: hypothetical protein VW827_03600 [Alphaproteobacteria bacterium]